MAQITIYTLSQFPVMAVAENIPIHLKLVFDQIDIGDTHDECNLRCWFTVQKRKHLKLIISFVHILL